MCAAPGTSTGASTRQCGVASRQGAENSALKNIAPFKRTPLSTSEKASILRSAKFSGVCAKHSNSAGRMVKKLGRSGMVGERAVLQNRAVIWEVSLTSERAACVVFSLLTVSAAVAQPATAQPSLSLSDAIQRARTHNPDVG